MSSRVAREYLLEVAWLSIGRGAGLSPAPCVFMALKLCMPTAVGDHYQSARSYKQRARALQTSRHCSSTIVARLTLLAQRDEKMNAATGPRRVVTSENFAEHIREVEQFIEGTDPRSLLMERLARAVTTGGVDNLTSSERLYFAYEYFAGAMVNGLLENFFLCEPASICDAVAESLEAIGEPLLSGEYKILRRAFVEGGLSDDDEEPVSELSASFITQSQDLDRRFGEYAQDHGLLD